jgi:hypothetical protein
MSVTIEFDHRARRWRFLCGCGWHGDASNLSVAAAPLGEHTRSCDGHRERSKATRYNVDSHAAGRRRELDPPKHPDRAQPDRRAAAARQMRSKITADDVREMRTRAANGDTQKAIAETYGLAQATVSAIIRRATWSDVE